MWQIQLKVVVCQAGLIELNPIGKEKSEFGAYMFHISIEKKIDLEKKMGIIIH